MEVTGILEESVDLELIKVGLYTLSSPRMASDEEVEGCDDVVVDVITFFFTAVSVTLT